MDAKQRPELGCVLVDRQRCHIGDSVQRSQAASTGVGRSSRKNANVQFGQRDHGGRHLGGN